MTQSNHYPGINPHLNSRLQAPGGGWESFHAACIEELTDILEFQRTRYIASLHDYYVLEAASLQLSDCSPPDDYMMSAVVYKLDSPDVPGRPITRIEILSPANKPGGTYYEAYLRNRRLTLQSGLCLIEIDWLHERGPVIPTMPSYPEREDGAYPYTIIVSDPRPSLTEGETQVYGFRVCDNLPIVDLPLADTDVVRVDFGQVYQQTYAKRRAFRLLTDYTTLPEHFNTYDEQDQTCIRQQMAAIEDSE